MARQKEQRLIDAIPLKQEVVKMRDRLLKLRETQGKKTGKESQDEALYMLERVISAIDSARTMD